jgi:hypothetical protein
MRVPLKTTCTSYREPSAVPPGIYYFRLNLETRCHHRRASAAECDSERMGQACRSNRRRSGVCPRAQKKMKMMPIDARIRFTEDVAYGLDKNTGQHESNWSPIERAGFTLGATTASQSVGAGSEEAAVASQPAASQQANYTTYKKYTGHMVIRVLSTASTCVV